ncbi:MAG TPA: hypothetical protein PKD55_26670 [Bellilinea sp.]|nr:hypothetical protein [Bellilinea sp.]
MGNRRLRPISTATINGTEYVQWSDVLKYRLQEAGKAADDLQSARAEIQSLRTALSSAHDALRSYQYGNGSPELAQEVADKLQKVLKGGE